MSPGSVARCAYYGAVPVRAAHPSGWEVKLDPSWVSAADLYDAWVAGILSWDHETTYAHKRIRNAANVMVDHPQPEGLDAFVVNAQTLAGLNRDELTAYFENPGRRNTDLRRILDALPEYFENARRNERRLPCDLTTAITLRPHLKLADTFATQQDGIEPDPKWLGGAIACSHISDLACAVQIIVALNPDNALYLGRGFETLDKELRNRNSPIPPSPDDIANALCAILVRARSNPGKRYMPVRAVRAVLTALRALTIYRSSHPGQIDWLGDLLDRRIYREPELTKLLGALERSCRKAGIARRHSDAESVKDRFESFRQAVQGRIAEAVACAQAVSAAKKHASEHFRAYDQGKAIESFFDFSAPVPMLNADGIPVPGATQLVHWRIWRERDLWASLKPHDDLCPNYCGLNAGDRERLATKAKVYDGLLHGRSTHAASDRLFCEYTGHTPLDGVNSQEPHFVTLYSLGILTAPSHLPPNLQRERLQYIRDNRITLAALGRGPLGFIKAETGLAAWARRVGRCIVPIEDYALALRLAGAAIDVVSECHARVSEVLQLEQTSQCLRIDLGPTQASVGFRAIPKGETAERDFLLTQSTFHSLLALARDVGRRSGDPTGTLRVVRPETRVATKIAGSRPLIFQWKGRAIDARTLNLLVGITGAGYGRITMHILRHASANARHRKDVPIATMAQLLGHDDERTTEQYISPTPTQAAMDVVQEEIEAVTIARQNADLARMERRA